MGNSKSGVKELFSGDLLILNVFMYTLMPLMVLFFFLQPAVAFLIILSYCLAFWAWWSNRALGKRRKKEGLVHFDARVFREKDFHEELMISFKKHKAMEIEEIEMDTRTNVSDEASYKNALMVVVKEESEMLRPYEDFLKTKPNGVKSRNVGRPRSTKLKTKSNKSTKTGENKK